jgi:hypothetical protein
MPDHGEGEEQPAVSPLSKAADRIRESAKWLIASFAAVGAILIAGLQIADIGGLTGSRLAWAIVGIILGVAGVVFAIAAASSVVTKSFVTLKALADQSKDQEPRKSLDGDRVLLGGYESVSDLHDAYASAMAARVHALEVHYAKPTVVTKDTADRTRDWANVLDRIQKPVLDRASFLTLANSYKKARYGILCGAGLTAFGIATFAWAANPPEPSSPSPVVAKIPSNVTVVIRRPSSTLKMMLGSTCDLTAVKAIAIADLGANYQVTSIPTSRCKAAVFVVTPAMGRVVLATASSSGASG